MKIVMTLLVRDEQDIIQHNIEYHLSQGVDFFIATDHLSEDGTSEILKRYEETGVLHYIRETNDGFNRSAWGTRMARLAYSAYGANWVINNDADQFWWPQEGNLRTMLSQVPAECNVVQAGLCNFVPVDESNEPFYERMVYRTKAPLNLAGRMIPPQIVHRGHPDITLSHNCRKIGGMGPLRLYEGPVEILHFPLRTYAQFEHKVITGGQALEGPRRQRRGVGRVWRGLYWIYRQGRLPDFYRLQEYTTERIHRALSNGLVRDTRLAGYLQQHYSVKGAADIGGQARHQMVTRPEIIDLTRQPGLGDIESDLWQTALRQYCRGRWSLGKLRRVIRPMFHLALQGLFRWSPRQLRRLKKGRGNHPTRSVRVR